MLDALSILNGIFLAGVMASNVTLYSDADYKFHTSGEERETVTLVSTHREWWRDDGNGKCKYIGLMVPYVRDWPETVRHGEVDDVLAPEPDKTAGQAFIFNRKVCEGKPDEAIFRVANIARTYGGFLKNQHFAAQDASGMKEEDRPKWLKQVLERIERVAQVDTTAKDFLEFTALAVSRTHSSESTSPAGSAPSAHATSVGDLSERVPATGGETTR
ncbi:hypothetical protein GO300_03813 [Ralstonia solanacearum]|nr:hypothetical protein [Ralstonia solanacearum]